MITNPAVFLLSTYPISQPRHGGQIRLAQIASVYLRAGFRVDNLALYQPEAYSKEQLGERDIALDRHCSAACWDGEFIEPMADFLSGAYAASNLGAWNAIKERLPSLIDVIHVEQPWLWPVAKRIAALPGYENVKLVYGSQNIEAPLKQAILEASNLNTMGAQKMVNAVAKLEQQACQEADLVIAVSGHDARQLQAWGALAVALGENGITPWVATADKLNHWRVRLPCNPWPLYVSSAHLPNYQGFAVPFANSLYSLAMQNTQLVVAGGVSPFIKSEFAATQFPLLNRECLLSLGVLSDSDLAAVKSLAHAFVLPINAGGGTNIKTAEALYSGAHVIASPMAFRGYEEFLDMPQVLVANRPAQFHQMLFNCLSMPRSSLNPADRIRLEKLTWINRLEAIPRKVMALLES